MPRLLLLPLLVAVVAVGGGLWWWLARRRIFEPLSEIELLRGIARRGDVPAATSDGKTQAALYPPPAPRLECEGCGCLYQPFPEGHQWARLGKCRTCLSPWVDQMRQRFRGQLRARSGRVA